MCSKSRIPMHVYAERDLITGLYNLIHTRYYLFRLIGIIIWYVEGRLQYAKKCRILLDDENYNGNNSLCTVALYNMNNTWIIIDNRNKRNMYSLVNSQIVISYKLCPQIIEFENIAAMIKI